MSRYARMAGRRKYPGHRKRMMAARSAAHASAGSPQPEKTVGGGENADATLVCVGSKINGVVKSAISPEILAKTEGMGWHQRAARIHALTGIPFHEVRRSLYGDN